VIRIDTRGDVRVLHWSGGENRFNRASLAALHAALDEVEAVDGPVGLVLTGEGKFWSNGLDLDWLLAGGPETLGFLDDVHALFGRLLLFPAVTVAAINGHAFAAGAMLSCCCDYRVMRDDRGYWCLPEADLGLPLTRPMYAVVANAVPRPTLGDAVIRGRWFNATEALAGGIVHEAAAEADVVARAVALAAEVAPKDRATLTRHKELLSGATAEICGWPRPAG
jgi:enoyl-CoA hydratase/carnithine racemase